MSVYIGALAGIHFDHDVCAWPGLNIAEQPVSSSRMGTSKQTIEVSN